jgi:Mor family transcriptional regulator
VNALVTSGQGPCGVYETVSKHNLSIYGVAGTMKEIKFEELHTKFLPEIHGDVDYSLPDGGKLEATGRKASVKSEGADGKAVEELVKEI